MQGNCKCQHHELNNKESKNIITSSSNQKQVSISQKLVISEQEHLINLLQKKFISPYKIIYTIDQQQADHFKHRNQSVGCCSSSSITIVQSEQTKLEKILVEVTNFYYLLKNLDQILRFCSDRYENILKQGTKDGKTKVTDDLQKFLVDKILSEGINFYLYKKVVEKLREQSCSLNSQIGLWATPVTWHQKYPKIELNFLQKQSIGDIMNNKKGYSITQGYFKPYYPQLIKQLSLLEKDGKFQEILWRQRTLASKNDKKILFNPEKYASILNSQQQSLFPRMKELVMIFSSLPFQLNAKANIFCTISENTHISYYNEVGYFRMHQDDMKYTVLANFGSSILLMLKDKKQEMLTIDISEASLTIIDNTLYSYEYESKESNFFMVRNHINCLKKP